MLSRAQLLVLLMLRDAASREAATPASTPVSADQPPFARLSRLCAAHGISIGQPRSGFASLGECLVLAAIADAGDVRPTLVIDPEFQAVLRACAAALSATNIRLPLHRPMRTILENHGWSHPASAAGSKGERRHRDGGRSAPREGSVRARAIDLARGRASVSTTEFAAIGVSRQYLSMICADGLLDRVRFGEYRLPPLAEEITPVARTES